MLHHGEFQVALRTDMVLVVDEDANRCPLNPIRDRVLFDDVRLFWVSHFSGDFTYDRGNDVAGRGKDTLKFCFQRSLSQLLCYC